MTKITFSTNNTILVAIDVAKATNDIIIQFPDGKRKKLKVANMGSKVIMGLRIWFRLK